MDIYISLIGSNIIVLETDKNVWNMKNRRQYILLGLVNCGTFSTEFSNS